LAFTSTSSLFIVSRGPKLLRNVVNPSTAITRPTHGDQIPPGCPLYTWVRNHRPVLACLCTVALTSHVTPADRFPAQSSSADTLLRHVGYDPRCSRSSRPLTEGSIRFQGRRQVRETNHPLMKSSRSALTRSLCVVHMPCGAPG
jgi:hypothetical protein